MSEYFLDTKNFERIAMPIYWKYASECRSEALRNAITVLSMSFLAHFHYINRYTNGFYLKHEPA